MVNPDAAAAAGSASATASSPSFHSTSFVIAHQAINAIRLQPSKPSGDRLGLKDREAQLQQQQALLRSYMWHCHWVYCLPNPSTLEACMKRLRRARFPGRARARRSTPST